MAAQVELPGGKVTNVLLFTMIPSRLVASQERLPGFVVPKVVLTSLGCFRAGFKKVWTFCVNPRTHRESKNPSWIPSGRRKT